MQKVGKYISAKVRGGGAIPGGPPASPADPGNQSQRGHAAAPEKTHIRSSQVSLYDANGVPAKRITNTGTIKARSTVSWSRGLCNCSHLRGIKVTFSLVLYTTCNLSAAAKFCII